MAVIIGKTYTDVTVPEGTKEFEFPDTVVGGVRPGTLNSMKGWVAIKWGVNMTEPIEPGVIPYVGAPGSKTSTCALMLDENYKHCIDKEAIPDSVYVFIHDSNRALCPTDRQFWLWRRDEPFTKKEFDGTAFTVCDVMKTRTFEFVAGNPIYLANVKRTTTAASQPIVMTVKTVKTVNAFTPPTLTPAPALATQAEVDDLKSQFYGLACKVSDLEATITKLTSLIDLSKLKTSTD